jgi:hypothetical protein
LRKIISIYLFLILILIIPPISTIAVDIDNPEIEAEIIGSIKLLGLPGFGIYVVNKGYEPIYNLSVELSVSGGFNNNIESIFKKDLKDVLQGKVNNTVHSATCSIIWGIYGLGPIQIESKVYSLNADTLTINTNGFQIGYYTFILT